VKGKRVCYLHGGRAGAPRGERNGAFKHGGWSAEAIELRASARRLLKRIGQDEPVKIEEAMARRARRDAGEVLPYTRSEAQALIAYARKTIKEKAGTRAQRSAANKAAWAAGDRGRWGKTATSERSE